jgi:CRP-like cAMP-binding protein
LRVVNYLLRQIPEGEPGGARVELAAPKKTIAARLSIQPETLSRVFHNLEHAGIIEVTGSVITVHQPERLQELVYN